MLERVSSGIPITQEAMVLIPTLRASLNAFSVFSTVMFLFILSRVCWSALSTPMKMVMHPESFIVCSSSSSRVSTLEVQPHQNLRLRLLISLQKSRTNFLFNVNVSSINAIVSMFSSISLISISSTTFV